MLQSNALTFNCDACLFKSNALTFNCDACLFNHPSVANSKYAVVNLIHT